MLCLITCRHTARERLVPQCSAFRLVQPTSVNLHCVAVVQISKQYSSFVVTDNEKRLVCIVHHMYWLACYYCVVFSLKAFEMLAREIIKPYLPRGANVETTQVHTIPQYITTHTQNLACNAQFWGSIVSVLRHSSQWHWHCECHKCSKHRRNKNCFDILLTSKNLTSHQPNITPNTTLAPVSWLWTRAKLL